MKLSFKQFLDEDVLGELGIELGIRQLLSLPKDEAHEIAEWFIEAARTQDFSVEIPHWETLETFYMKRMDREGLSVAPYEYGPVFFSFLKKDLRRKYRINV